MSRTFERENSSSTIAALVAARAVALIAGLLAGPVDPRFRGIACEPDRILYLGALGSGPGSPDGWRSSRTWARRHRTVREGGTGRREVVVAAVLVAALIPFFALRLVPL